MFHPPKKSYLKEVGGINWVKEGKATKEITKEIAGEKKHPAIFPEELVEKCIKVSGLKKGIMFDCFAGTGTSLLVAKKMGLDYFNICPFPMNFVKPTKSLFELNF